MNSIWKLNLEKPSYESINKNLNIPVAIIGGGMSGILVAYHIIYTNLVSNRLF